MTPHLREPDTLRRHRLVDGVWFADILKPGLAGASTPSLDTLRQPEERTFMGLVTGIITGALLLACALVAVWMAGAIYYDVCGGARWGRWAVLAWAIGVIAMFAAWRPLRQPLVALLGAESLFLVWWYRLKPSNDRDWDPSAAVLPRAASPGMR